MPSAAADTMAAAQGGRQGSGMVAWWRGTLVIFACPVEPDLSVQRGSGGQRPCGQRGGRPLAVPTSPIALCRGAKKNRHTCAETKRARLHTQAKMACIVCEEGDDCGPVQLTDCCVKPFHWDHLCARALGIQVKTCGPVGDLLCAACESEGARATTCGFQSATVRI